MKSEKLFLVMGAISRFEIVNGLKMICQLSFLSYLFADGNW